MVDVSTTANVIPPLTRQVTLATGQISGEERGLGGEVNANATATLSCLSHLTKDYRLSTIDYGKGEVNANTFFSPLRFVLHFTYCSLLIAHCYFQKLSTQLLIALILCLLCFVYPAAAQELSDVLRVPTDYPTIAAAIDAAPIGATIEIAAGEYEESVVITRALTLRGTGDTILRGTSDSPVILIQDTHAVVIEHLTITGGQYGISVLRSRRVTIQNNVITENRLLGVRVRMASAHILDNTITHTQPPYGRGIHIMNTMDYPESRVIGNTVSYNALAGIITNMVNTVYIADNIVTHNGHRGIAIAEMSRAWVANNFIEDNGETGIYVSDSSTAIVCGNTVINSHVLSVAGEARYGNGITIDFGSTVELRGNTVIGSDNYGISVLSASMVTLNQNTLNDNEAGALWVDDDATTLTDATLPEECG